MSYLEKFSDFIKGELGNEDEQDFANQLAIDPQMRTMFKNFLVMKDTMRRSSEEYAPPPETKEAVFKKLGFTSASTASAVGSGAKVFWSFLKSRWFIGIVPALAAALLTFFITSSLLDNDSAVKGKDKSDNFTNSTKIDNNEVTGIKPKEVNSEMTNSDKETTHAGAAEQSFASLANNEIFESEKKESLTSIEEKTNTNDLKNISIDDKVENNNPARLNTDDNLEKYKAHLSEQNDPFNEKVADEKEKTDADEAGLFRLEIKHTPDWSLSDEKIQPEYVNRFNNIEFGLLYDVSESFAFGINLRQEMYYTEYNFTVDGQQNNVFQHHNLTVVGVTGQYSAAFINWKVNPFIRINAGLSKYGIITRELFGLEYKPYKNAYFHLGFEFGQFFYKQNNSNFNANKVSLIYGIGVKF